MTNKAFIFDMDGVLIDSETEWNKYNYENLLTSFFGKELTDRFRAKSGMSIKGIFDSFVELGWKGNYQDFFDIHEEYADKIYGETKLTKGIDLLINKLSRLDYKIAVVSSSPLSWVKKLVNRIKSKEKIIELISVNNHKTLNPKPSPDPYLYAMEKLDAKPQKTIILEDSKPGLESALSANAHVIWFSAYYKEKNIWQDTPPKTEYKAGSLEKVMEIVDKINKSMDNA